MKNEIRQLIFVGDIHGNFGELVWNLVHRYKIECADVIVLGDFGVGFDNSLDFVYKKFRDRLEKFDLRIYTIRGNHDNPKYFIKEDLYSYPRLRFMEDYKVYKFGRGIKILPIGGANSVDITYRLEENKKLRNKHKDRQVWWGGEEIEFKDLSDLPQDVDIIISHEAPLCFDPIISRREDCPEYQFERIKKSREYLNDVLEYIKPNYWYYGHYHTSYYGRVEKTNYRCLNIMEVFKHEYDTKLF